MLYRVLKFLITIGIKLYYKEISIIHKDKLPKDGPLIVVANHPNTMIDGWVLGLLYKQPIHFMAKATFFNSKLKKWILTKFKMIPINRASDGKTKGVNNVSSFESCFKLLDQKGILVIFPEGTSFKERFLREIKSGTSRIAIDFAKKHHFDSGLKIVPIGINYSQAEKFRSRILVDVGDSIPIDQCYDDELKYKENVNNLTSKIRLSLEKVLVTPSDKFQDVLLEKIQSLYIRSYKISANVKKKMDELKELKNLIEAIAITRPYALYEIDELATRITEKVTMYNIKPDYLSRGSKLKSYAKEIFGSMILLLLGFPIYVYGAIHNIFQYFITDIIIRRITNEVEYFAPLGIIIGLFLYPLTYAGFGITANYFFELKGFWLAMYLVSLPVSGLIAITINKNMKHVYYKWKFYLLLKHKKQELEVLRKEYAQLTNLLDV